MTAATVTEISTEPIVSGLASGAEKRRVRIYMRVTVDAGGSNTVDLSTYIPNIADVEGALFCTDDGAALDVAGDITWSTYTVTVVPVGAIEVGLVGTLT